MTGSGTTALFRAIALCGGILIVNCSVSYDEVADHDINSVTHEIDQQFQIWAAQAAAGKPVAYDENTTNAYGKIEGDLAALSVRLSASPDLPTRNMSARAQSLRDQVEGMRNLHAKEKAIANPQFFIGEEKLLDAQLTVLNTYETTLKSGASTSTASSDASARAVIPPRK
jgi:hypothetical protein